MIDRLIRYLVQRFLPIVLDCVATAVTTPTTDRPTSELSESAAEKPVVHESGQPL